MKVKIIKKNVFLGGLLLRVGRTYPLSKESDFNEKFMEWVEKPVKPKKKAAPKAKAKTTKKVEKPVEVEAVKAEE